MIVILDYGMGNAASIKNMISKLGGGATVASSLKETSGLTGIILPGVGSFDNAMKKLNDLNLIEDLRESVLNKQVPFLGICLGMQLLFDSSEEGRLLGLGFIPGYVQRFASSAFDNNKLKIPHMGWNTVRLHGEAPLFRGDFKEQKFYFVHSYHAVCREDSDISAICHYGYDFPCAITRNNIYATQFHPEKSHKFGMNLLKNFMEITC